MPKIVWSNFTGLAPASNQAQISTIELRIGEEGMFAGADRVNPIVRPGYLTPGFGFTESTNASSVVDARIQRFQVEDNVTAGSSFAYGLEAGEKIHQVELLNFAVTSSATWPHTINHSHTSELGEDCLIVNMNGTRYLLYSFNDSTDGDIGRHTLGTTTFDDSWFSGIAAGNKVLTAGVPHPLVEGDNGFGYVGDGNSIHKLDLQNNTVTLSVIDLPLDWVIQEFAKYRGFLYIVANKKTDTIISSQAVKRDVAVFVWNYVSLQAGNETGFSDIIPIGDASFGRHIFVHEGNLWLVTEDGITAKYKQYNGSDFTTIDSGRLSGIQPSKSPGSIESYFGNVMIGGDSGAGTSRILTLGNVPGSDRIVRNHIAGSFEGNMGAITRTRNAGTYLFSIGSSIYSNLGFLQGGTGSFTDLFSTLFVDLPYRSRIKRCNVLFMPFTSATSSQFSVAVMKNSSVALVSAHKIFLHSAIASTGFATFPVAGDSAQNANSVAVRLRWGLESTDGENSRAPVVYRIEVEYEPTTKKI